MMSTCSCGERACPTIRAAKLVDTSGLISESVGPSACGSEIKLALCSSAPVKKRDFAKSHTRRDPLSTGRASTVPHVAVRDAALVRSRTPRFMPCGPVRHILAVLCYSPLGSWWLRCRWGSGRAPRFGGPRADRPSPVSHLHHRAAYTLLLLLLMKDSASNVSKGYKVHTSYVGNALHHRHFPCSLWPQ